MEIKMAKTVINLEDLFITTKQTEGVWYEAKDGETPTGLMFKILGVQSDKSVIARDAYDKALELVEKEKDPVKKAHLNKEAAVDLVASVIVDMKSKDGCEARLGGKEVEYSDELVRKILNENINIRSDLFAASLKTETFMTKKS